MAGGEYTAGQLGPKGESVTTTSKQLSPSSTSKRMSRLGLQSTLDAKRAEDEAIAAMEGGEPVVGPPTLEQVSDALAATARDEARKGEVAADLKAEDLATEPAKPQKSVSGNDEALAKLGINPADAVDEFDLQAAAPQPVAKPAPAPETFDPEEYQRMVEQTAAGQRVPTPELAQEPVDGEDQKHYTAADLAASKEMQGPKTLAAAQDEAAQFVGATKAKADDAYAKNLERINAETERQRLETQQRIDQLAAQKAQNVKLTSLFSDMSPVQRVFTALAVGLGSAGGGPNYAADILQREMQADFERKKARADQYVEELKAARARPEQILHFMSAAREQALASHKAALDLIEAQAARMLSPFPQAQSKLKEAMAGARAKYAQDLRDHVLSSTSEESHVEGEKQVVATGKAQGDGKGESSIDAKNYAIMQENAELSKRLMSLVKRGKIPTSEQLRKYDQNKNAFIARAKAEMEGGAFERWKSDLGRMVGSIPESIYPEGMDAEAKEALDIAQSLAHQRGVNLFGQGAMGTHEGRAEYMSNVTGVGGDLRSDVVRKLTGLAHEFATMGETAKKFSRSGEKEQRLEAAQARASTSAGLPPEKLSKVPDPFRSLYRQALASPNKTDSQKRLIAKVEEKYGK